MRRLLRSVIDFGDGKTPPEALNSNFQRLQGSKIEWAQPVDQRIYQFLYEYFVDNFELPALQTLVDFFTRSNDVEATEQLKYIQAAPVYIRKNYEHLLSELLEDQNRIKMQGLLKDVSEIVSKGLIVPEGREKKQIKGVKEGMLYFNEKVHELIPPVGNARVRGDIRDDGEAVWEEYQTAKHSKGKILGKYTGITPIDRNCKGVKKGELWVHAGFAGEMKTTMATNWAYNLTTKYRSNVLYISLEMPYVQIRKLLFTIHSGNVKWGRKALDYRKVRDGELSPEDEEFLHKVTEDFSNNPEHCRLQVWCPDKDVTIEDIRIEAELLNKEMDVGMIVIDHGGLVAPTKKHKDYTIELNAILRDSKKLALHFDGGAGVPVLMLFQLNRQGKDDADKNNGQYKMKALSYANECLAEGTLVATDQGYLPIERVPVGSHVWSRSGWKEVLHFFNKGVQPTVQVEMESGISITVTRNHRLLRMTERGLEWGYAEQLRPGDWLVSNSTYPFAKMDPELPPLQIEKYDKPSGERGVLIQVPRTLTPDLAYLMGAYKGDGVGGNAYKFGFTGNRKELAVQARLQESFLRTFGHPLGLIKAKSRPGSFDLCKWSKPLKRWVLKVGMDRLPGTPESVLAGTEASVVSYLKGLWDTDGCVNCQGQIYLSQKKSHRLTLEHAQLLMGGLGMLTDLSSKVARLNGKKYPQSVLRVRGYQSMCTFQSIIGFTESWKKDRLSRHIQGLTVERVDKRTFVPALSVLRFIVAQHRPLFSGHRAIIRALRGQSNTVSIAVIREAVRLLHSNGIESEGLKMFYEGLHAHQVRNVSEQAPSPVYDLEVTGDHEYATAGLLSHNCERSADCVTTTYLNDTHRKNLTTVFCNLKNRDNPLFEPFLASVDFESRRIFNYDPTFSKSDGMSCDEHVDLSIGV